MEVPAPMIWAAIGGLALAIAYLWQSCRRDRAVFITWLMHLTFGNKTCDIGGSCPQRTPVKLPEEVKVALDKLH
ncbi:MAG: hypothetical protein H6981_07285 [Gammaproteobacteria bacterium]|nr:hypothetical protein [Gammaproteobacteria bacterium]